MRHGYLKTNKKRMDWRQRIDAVLRDSQASLNTIRAPPRPAPSGCDVMALGNRCAPRWIESDMPAAGSAREYDGDRMAKLEEVQEG